MATMDSDLYDALISAGAPDDKARAAAASFAESRLATKEDINGLERLTKDEINRLERDLTVLKWLGGLVLAAQVIPLLRSFGL